jgi:hypothetical protein
MLLNATLDSSLLRVQYGFEVLDLWEVVERVAGVHKKQGREPHECLRPPSSKRFHERFAM